MPVTASDIALAHALADAAGAAIRPYFRGDLGLELKADRSPVTLADRAAEAAMRRLIEAERSGDGIIGEEYGEKAGVSGRTWVLDPIDGTKSFSVGRAIFGTLVALVGSSGWVEVALVNGDAARQLTVGPGATVWVTRGKPAPGARL